MQGNISSALSKIRSSLEKILGTNVSKVKLVAVSKTKPVELIKEVYDEGVRDFGENYVQEIVEKAPKLPSDIKWHFIGSLQSNKVKQVLVPNLYMIQTLDSMKLAAKVDKECGKQNRKLKVLVQVKSSNEESKSGIALQNLEELIEFIVKSCHNLEFPFVLRKILRHYDNRRRRGFRRFQGTKGHNLRECMICTQKLRRRIRRKNWSYRWECQETTRKQ